MVLKAGGPGFKSRQDHSVFFVPPGPFPFFVYDAHAQHPEMLELIICFPFFYALVCDTSFEGHSMKEKSVEGGRLRRNPKPPPLPEDLVLSPHVGGARAPTHPTLKKKMGRVTLLKLCSYSREKALISRDGLQIEMKKKLKRKKT